MADDAGRAGSNNDDRDALIGRLAFRFEQIESDQASLAADKRLIAQDCKEADLNPAEIAALKRIAKLKVADKLDAERKKMSAMRTVGTAMGIDLFNWQDQQ